MAFSMEYFVGKVKTSYSRLLNYTLVFAAAILLYWNLGIHVHNGFKIFLE